MRKTICLMALAALIVSPPQRARAQDVPKFDVYGGYSYMVIQSASADNNLSASGWELAASWNLSHWLGITVDGNGSYCCSGQYLYTVAVGPTFTFRKEKRDFFLHALFGNGSAKGLSETASDYTWMVGGGIDWILKPGLAIRVPQVDYIDTHFLNGSENDWRISAGVVFRFGKQTGPSSH